MKGLDLFIRKKDASVGIGTMIVFIAMILVAAIAASVLIQTSNALQTQAKKTGSDTIKEVSIGVNIIDVCGQYGTRIVNGSSVSRIHNMTITITPRAGSKEIDLFATHVVITDGSSEFVLKTNETLPVIADSTVPASIFEKVPQSHPELSTVFDLSSGEYGIIVLKDYDGSCTENSPAINRGDKIMLTVNLTALFGGVPQRTNVWGRVVTEEGAQGIFNFRTPAGYQDIIIDLQ
jgi:flagellin FlaB